MPDGKPLPSKCDVEAERKALKGEALEAKLKYGGTRHTMPDGTYYYALNEIPFDQLKSADELMAAYELSIKAANESAGGPKARH